MAGFVASRPPFGCVTAWIVSPVAPLDGASRAASRKEFSTVPCSSARRGRRSESVSPTVRASIVVVWPLFSGGRHFGDFEEGFLGGELRLGWPLIVVGGHQRGAYGDPRGQVRFDQRQRSYMDATYGVRREHKLLVS